MLPHWNQSMLPLSHPHFQLGISRYRGPCLAKPRERTNNKPTKNPNQSLSVTMPYFPNREDVPTQGSHHPARKTRAGTCRQPWLKQMVKHHLGMFVQCFAVDHHARVTAAQCGTPATLEVGKQGLAGDNQHTDWDKLLKWGWFTVAPAPALVLVLWIALMGVLAGSSQAPGQTGGVSKSQLESDQEHPPGAPAHLQATGREDTWLIHGSTAKAGQLQQTRQQQTYCCWP